MSRDPRWPSIHAPRAAPEGLRRQVLEAAKKKGEADGSLFFSLAMLAGKCHFTSALSCETHTQAVLDADVEGRPGVDVSSILDAAPRSFQRDRFGTVATGAPLPSKEDPLHHAAYRRFQVADHARIVVFDGRRLVGWLAILKSGGRCFTGAQLERLQKLAPDVVSALVHADRVERALLDPRPQLVVDVDGNVYLTSGSGDAWLTERRAEAIGSAVRSQSSEGLASATRLVAGAEATISVLLGQPTYYHLVTLAAPVAPELTPAFLLTQRQREIASHAVAGLTRGDIARQLSISEETVRSHLKIIYERLGVASRVELANALRSEP